VLLAGIVATQVEILKLGATMGRALQQTATLSTENEQLRGSVAALGDDQRIERLAANMGMVLPPPGSVGYLRAKPGGEASGALGNLQSPDAAAFVMLPARNGALVTGPGTSTLPPAAGAPPPPAATTTTSTTATPATTTTSVQTSSASATSGQTTPTIATTTSPTTSETTTTPQDTSATTASTTSGQPTGAAAIEPSSSSQGGG
jgi:hypothetical protein